MLYFLLSLVLTKPFFEFWTVGWRKEICSWGHFWISLTICRSQINWLLRKAEQLKIKNHHTWGAGINSHRVLVSSQTPLRDTIADSKRHQGSITNKRGLSNAELSTFDLPLTNPFSFVNSCCGPVVIRPNPAQVAGLRGSHPLIWPLLLFWADTPLTGGRADKSTVTNDITHIHGLHPWLPVM